MGTGNSVSFDDNNFGVSESVLRKVSDYQDKRFGPVTILKEILPPKRTFIRKTVPYNSAEDIKSIQQKLKLRRTLGGFYAQITGHNVEKIDKLCLQELRMEITVHYSKNSLHSEIKKRSEMGRGFEIEELMHILIALVNFCDSMDLLRNHEQMLGPEIVMLYPKGDIAIIETQFLRPGVNRYKKMLAISFEPVKPDKWEIMAPEELKSLRSRSPSLECSTEKIHTFNVGITMLCAIACKPPSWFYDLSKFQYLPSRAEKVLNESNLNFDFLSLIKCCLEVNPDKRPKCVDLLEKLQNVKTRLQIESNLEEVMFKKNINNISMY
jgi:hypothetical protein